MDQMKELKKYDLHCHLDGSLSERIVRKLAFEANIAVPGDLRQSLQVQPDCRSLKEYLMKFDLPLSCLVTGENFKLAVMDVMENAARENVVYMEIRFAPLLSVHEGLSVGQIMESAADGIREGKRCTGVEANLIICGMRHMAPEANVELVKEARELLGFGVCAMDLAGDEAAFPVKTQSEMFRTAQRLGMPFTIHAGECGNARSVWDAIELGASRIGHGIAAKKDAELMNLCASKHIPLEMCPTSNLQTKAVQSMAEYPFMEFLDAGIAVTVNTDNRTVSNTTITKELELLKDYYHLSFGDLEMLMRNAEEAVFGRQEFSW